MRAVVFTAPGRMEVDERPDPVPGPREVLVQVAAVGICGTDVHVLDGEFAPTRFPIIPGHEATGVVESIGSAVTTLAPGDPVVIDPSFACGECRYCAAGRSNLCEEWDGAGVARTDGYTADRQLAPVRNVHLLPPGVDLHEAALVEPLACAIRGFDRLPRRLGEHYLIYGAGTMGLLMAQLAPRAGAASVAVVDLNPARRQAARDVGLQIVVETPQEVTRPGGWDVVIDCTGAISAVEDALRHVRRGGTYQQFGVAPAGSSAAFSPFDLYHDEITMVGSMAVLQSFDRAVELFGIGAVDAKTMISHAFALDDYAAAIEAFRAGAGRKLQIRPGAAGSTDLHPDSAAVTSTPGRTD